MLKRTILVLLYYHHNSKNILVTSTKTHSIASVMIVHRAMHLRNSMKKLHSWTYIPKLQTIAFHGRPIDLRVSMLIPCIIYVLGSVLGSRGGYRLWRLTFLCLAVPLSRQNVPYLPPPKYSFAITSTLYPVRSSRDIKWTCNKYKSRYILIILKQNSQALTTVRKCFLLDHFYEMWFCRNLDE
jgi:hypothetical protein